MSTVLSLIPKLVWATAGALIFILIGQLLPHWVCHLNDRLATAAGFRRADLASFNFRFVPRPILAYLKNQLVRAGLRRPAYLQGVVLGYSLPPLALPALAIVFRWPVRQGFLVGLLVSILVHSWLNRRIQNRRRAFLLSLYKIYRFLDLQLTSGIKAMDVLKGLADVIDHPLIHPDFLRFCAQLELTLDLDQALLELEGVFAGPDMNLLAAQLRNSLQTGVIGQTFLRMENLMFNRHLSLIQAKSKQLRTHLLLVGLLALVPIEVIFIYPIVAQALTAFGQLFGP